MFNRTQVFELQCDAPPYPIVQGSRMVGIVRPEDVRWCRLSHFFPDQNRRLELFDVRTWKTLLGGSDGKATHCSCGRELPKLERYTFTFLNGKEVDYLLAQCPRCRTVFWE
jgi:hypothetical protein